MSVQSVPLQESTCLNVYVQMVFLMLIQSVNVNLAHQNVQHVIYLLSVMPVLLLGVTPRLATVKMATLMLKVCARLAIDIVIPVLIKKVIVWHAHSIGTIINFLNALARLGTMMTEIQKNVLNAQIPVKLVLMVSNVLPAKKIETSHQAVNVSMGLLK